MRGRLGRGVVVLVVGALIGGAGGAVAEPHDRPSGGSYATVHHRPVSVARPSAVVGSMDELAAPALADDGDAVIPPAPESFDAPPAPAEAPPAALADPVASTDGQGIWAVMIGIDDYPGTASDLRSAVADAETMNTALADLGVPVEHRLVVRNTQATAATIERATAWLVDHAGPDSTAVFFYAGHVRKLSADREAVVAADGRLVTDQQLAAWLDGVRSAHLWAVMASCYGGGFTELLRPGRVLTGAADADHLAYENTKLGHSYLVEYLVQKGLIEHMALPTVQDAFAYAYRALARDYPDRVPVEIDQAGTVVSLGPSDGTAPSPPSPPPTTPPPTPTTTTPPPQPPPKKCGNVFGIFCGK